MKPIPWTEEFSVDNKKIDAQHKLLIKWLNDLAAALVAGKSGEIVYPLLKKLASYAIHHFAYEERMMKLGNYSGLAEHHAEHDAFKAKLAGMIKEFEKSGLRSLDLANFMADWITRHIAGWDKKYQSSIAHLELAEEIEFIDE